ncbi:MAG: hypothetical protein ACI4N3_03765 [Alphaproteobacteria bacterium]
MALNTFEKLYVIKFIETHYAEEFPHTMYKKSSLQRTKNKDNIKNIIKNRMEELKSNKESLDAFDISVQNLNKDGEIVLTEDVGHYVITDKELITTKEMDEIMIKHPNTVAPYWVLRDFEEKRNRTYIKMFTLPENIEEWDVFRLPVEVFTSSENLVDKNLNLIYEAQKQR